MKIPRPRPFQKRVVIVGAGFDGLTLARKLDADYFQVVLLDRNNYHQFQPLLYQVATAGLEPSSISFPLRKVFQHKKHIVVRMTEVQSIDPVLQKLQTGLGELRYDYLVLAQGATTNYFNLSQLQQHAYSMKSVSEALLLRNTLLQHYEQALNVTSPIDRTALLNVVIVGGGPTGVELAGAIAEMKRKILPKDYAELNFKQMHIYLLEAAPGLLNGMSAASGTTVKAYLEQLGVEVQTNTSVKDYDGLRVQLSNGDYIYSKNLIWAAGVKGVVIPGIPSGSITAGNRILVNEYNEVQNAQRVFAIGDIAAMQSSEWPKGHPQVAQVAIQQAGLLAENLRRLVTKESPLPFQYRDRGSMATVGRNLATAEIGKVRLKGFIAWVVWMMIHLMSIIGIKNRLLILVNWVWQYLTYDQSLRLIIQPTSKNNTSVKHEQTIHTTNGVGVPAGL